MNLNLPKSNLRRAASAALFAFGLAASAQAGPTTMSFQGRLTDSSNNPLDGTYSIRFSIHDAASLGSELWNETQSVTVSNGAVDVELGSSTPIPDTVATASSAYLEVKVGADLAMTPRQKLMSVMYARNADLLGGSGASGFVSTSSAQGIGGAKTFTSSLTVGGADLQVGGILRAGSTPTALTAANGKLLLAALGAGALANDVIASSVAVGKVESAQILDGTVDFDDIRDEGCSSGEIIEWNGSAWACGTDEGGSGTVLTLNPSTNQDATTNNRPGIWLNKTGVAGDDVARFDKDDARRFAVHASSVSAYGIFQATGSILTNNNLEVDGTVTAGSGNTVLTNSAGELLPAAVAGGALDNDVIASSIAAGKVESAQILNGTIVKADLSLDGCAADKILKSNGSAWTCSDDLGSSGVLLLQDSLQEGATFFVSSGTANVLRVVDSLTLLTGGTLTLPAASVADSALSSNISRLNAAETVSGVKSFTSSVTVREALEVFGILKASQTAITDAGGNLLASALTGTVADARLSTNVSLLNAAETVAGAKTFDADLIMGTGDIEAASGQDGVRITTAVFVGSGADVSTITATAVSVPSLSIGGGSTIVKYLSVSSDLNFPAISSGTCGDLPITVTGAVLTDAVTLGAPHSLASTERLQLSAWVSAADTVTVRACCHNDNSGNACADPAQAMVRVDVWKR